MSFLFPRERCPFSIFPPRFLCPLCEPYLVFRICQLKSWRSQPTKSRDPYLGPLGNAWERRTLVRHVLALKPYRAVAKKRGAYAAMPLRGYRGVTNGTPRSPFCSLYTALLVFSAFSVPSVRTLFLRHVNLKVGVPSPRSLAIPTLDRLGTPGNAGL